MDYTVDAVVKALNLLFLVADQPGLGVTDLAKRSGVTKARSYRLLESLEKSGLVRRHGAAAIYALNYRALFLGAAAQEQISLVRLAKKYLARIGSDINESVYVRVREGAETICVAYWESTELVRVHAQLGASKPLHAGASGKLLLAHAEQEMRESILQAQLHGFTANTITAPEKLREELARIRQQGYSESFSEIASDTAAVAVPIWDVHGQVAAALGITAPSARWSAERALVCLNVLRNMARELSRELGYKGNFSME